MTTLYEIGAAKWNETFAENARRRAIDELEAGHVLYFPRLAFPLTESESRFLSPAVAGKSKNVSYDIGSGKLQGSGLDDATREPLARMMARFATDSEELLNNLLPTYHAGLIRARTSFRPAEVAGRSTSWRKDDTRLHVDSFPASPVRDKRILRVFTNVNPHGKSRSWRFGEPFETVATRFLPQLRAPARGSSQLLWLARVTKSRRSNYDSFMLQIHDRMKADMDYQSSAKQAAQDFPPGSTWIAFTDQVSHAAMAGQYLLEQTFYLPVGSMLDPSKSPLRILERLTNRKLA